MAGFSQAQATLSWNAVTTNQDGTATEDIDHYEIFQRLNGQPASADRQVATTTDTTINMSPYEVGTNWVFSVLAVDRFGNRGAKSAPLSLVMASDATPPQSPSTPIVTTRLGVVRAYWDGLPVSGAWPVDFLHIEVHQSTMFDFTPSAATLYDFKYGEGAAIITDIPYGTPVYVKFIAVDTSGNKSIPSAQGSATPAQLVNTDLITSIVDTRLLADDAVDTAAIQDLAVGTANMKDLSVVTAKIGNLQVNSAKIADLEVGKLTAGIMVAAVTVSGQFSTALTGDRVTFDATGLRAIRNGVTTVHISPTGAATFTGEITGSVVTGGTVRTATSGARLELTQTSGLVSYRPDGSLNFSVLRPSANASGEGQLDGAVLGVSASLRFQGGTLGGFIGKNNEDRKLLIRSSGSVATGAGIDMFDTNSGQGLDGDGHSYDNSIRFYSEGGFTALKLLANSVAVFRNGFIAPDMRITRYRGGTATSTTAQSYQLINGHAGMTFIGPPSGVVLIYLSLSLRSGDQTDHGSYCLAGMDVKVGPNISSGETVSEVSALVQNQNDSWIRVGGTPLLVQGLTRGSVYNVRALFCSNDGAGTGVWASDAEIVVIPSG